MAKQPEERAAELMAEMSALIEATERQIEQGRAVRAAAGLDDATIARMTGNLTADKKAEIQAAVEQDRRDIEDEVARAKVDTAHAIPASGARRPRMRPMI
ncbi:MAG TPA: hypothetical protein VK196_16290 [Magnetospirillum sp.]|nr:hypothetical protein [Magnetospirillum sp.]